jgi:hypothetical protein
MRCEAQKELARERRGGQLFAAMNATRRKEKNRQIATAPELAGAVASRRVFVLAVLALAVTPHTS